MDEGRPTDYKEEYNKQAEKLCKLGYTDKELAEFFDVAESTINLWKLKHTKFSESIRAGKDLADANVAESLYKRATGYEHPDVDIKVIDGNIILTPLTKYYPPDTAAARLWLINRQKRKWRDKVETGFTDGDGNDISPVQIYLPDNGRNKATKGVSGEGS